MINIRAHIPKPFKFFKSYLRFLTEFMLSIVCLFEIKMHLKYIFKNTPNFYGFIQKLLF